MIKIAVCDDEKNVRSYLISLIKEQPGECEVTEYASAEEYLSGGMEHDLLFLDIELKDSASGMDGNGINGDGTNGDGINGDGTNGNGINGDRTNGNGINGDGIKGNGIDGDGINGNAIDGIWMARRIRSMGRMKQPVIIFVTGYEKYVYDAFDVDAFQYLVKPINEQRFAEVFGRAQDKILSEAEQKKKTLVIQHAGANKAVPLASIYYMESQGHKIALYIKDGEQDGLCRLEYYAKIGELEEELRGNFCRIHKGYLVNLSYVDEYSRKEVILTNGDKLPLSKYKYEDFVKAYLRFMQ